MANERSGADDSSILAGRQPVLELLRAERTAERIVVGEHVAASKTISEIRKRANALGIPMRTAPKSEIDRLAGGLNHQGIVAITGRFRYTPLDDLLKAPAPALLFLDGVTDPHNLGSLLRSADGAGFTGVVLPARRSVGVTSAVRRVSAGAAEVVPVAREGNLGRAVDAAREAGLWILGLDEDAADDIWSSELLEPPVGIVLGAEDRGISPTIRERCDAVVSIPSSGRLSSLNVAVAGAIVMFELARRRRGHSDTL
ncbi:MAG: 23S rRNA (guanosine(2251)-2'-O)-methyltransferase RlmB [Actinobacteria bacterium]|nr:23S rRNA (guanosine(2251)-2'-O)-methyltransferase RlmB [Actinomycetota bacterium]